METGLLLHEIGIHGGQDRSRYHSDLVQVATNKD